TRKSLPCPGLRKPLYVLRVLPWTPDTQSHPRPSDRPTHAYESTQSLLARALPFRSWRSNLSSRASCPWTCPCGPLSPVLPHPPPHHAPDHPLPRTNRP